MDGSVAADARHVRPGPRHRRSGDGLEVSAWPLAAARSRRPVWRAGDRRHRPRRAEIWDDIRPRAPPYRRTRRSRHLPWLAARRLAALGRELLLGDDDWGVTARWLVRPRALARWAWPALAHARCSRLGLVRHYAAVQRGALRRADWLGGAAARRRYAKLARSRPRGRCRQCCHRGHTVVERTYDRRLATVAGDGVRARLHAVRPPALRCRFHASTTFIAGRSGSPDPVAAFGRAGAHGGQPANDRQPAHRRVRQRDVASTVAASRAGPCWFRRGSVS